jgi:6-pyruvoyltetrahydropterin/6-carboxytetrahydropterin synthase
MVFTSATLNESGFVIDFSDVKREVKAWVDLHWDHGTLLNVRDPLAPILKEMNQKLYLMEFNPTAENIAFELYDVFIKVYSNLSSVIVWETPTSQAVYTPKAQAHSGGYTM